MNRMTTFTQVMAAAVSCTTVNGVDPCGLPRPGSAQSTGYINVILSIVFAIAASVAVLMIVINGFRYIIARGEPGATASAKDGLLYSVIGLLVIMAAYSIVVFVVHGIS